MIREGYNNTISTNKERDKVINAKNNLAKHILGNTHLVFDHTNPKSKNLNKLNTRNPGKKHEEIVNVIADKNIPYQEWPHSDSKMSLKEFRDKETKLRENIANIKNNYNNTNIETITKSLNKEVETHTNMYKAGVSLHKAVNSTVTKNKPKKK